MTRPVDREIEELRELALGMGGLSEEILKKALRSLRERNAILAAEVQRDDREIDRLDVAIDAAVLRMLATRAPVAHDLRFVLATRTMATDLERVGDLARNIARSAARLSELPPAPASGRFERLASESARLLSKALDCFSALDASGARAVLAQDDEVDEQEDRFVREALDFMRLHPEQTQQQVEWILAAKQLERVADHATNIAEDVILAAEARNLKHAAKL